MTPQKLKDQTSYPRAYGNLNKERLSHTRWKKNQPIFTSNTKLILEGTMMTVITWSDLWWGIVICHDPTIFFRWLSLKILYACDAAYVMGRKRQTVLQNSTWIYLSQYPLIWELGSQYKDSVTSSGHLFKFSSHGFVKGGFRKISPKDWSTEHQ